MKGSRRDLPRIERALADPAALLRLMDEEGVERAALINYSAPDVLGFDETVNEWVSAFVRGHEERLVAVGSVHPRLARDAASETAHLFDRLGIRMLKLHPPHQLFAANGYRDGDEALRQIYATAEEMGRPVMIHTGTSIFPGARNRYSDPMAADDVAVDFPRLSIILAHAGRPLFMPTAAFLARRHGNVHLDLSGIPPQEAPRVPAAPRGSRRQVPLGDGLPEPGRSLDEEERGGLPRSADLRGGQREDSLVQCGRADSLTGGPGATRVGLGGLGDCGEGAG